MVFFIIFLLLYQLVGIPLSCIIAFDKKIQSVNGKLTLKSYFKDELAHDAIKGIRFLYEDLETNQISKKKVLKITIFFNLAYGLILYIGFYRYGILQEQYKSIYLFLFLGTIIGYIQEYFAYKITRNYIKKYSETFNSFILYKGICVQCAIFILAPFLFIITLFMMTKNSIILFFFTSLLYFFPLTTFLFSSQVIPLHIGIYQYLLLIPFLSIFLPYIILFTYKISIIKLIISFFNFSINFLYKINQKNLHKNKSIIIQCLVAIAFLCQLVSAFFFTF